MNRGPGFGCVDSSGVTDLTQQSLLIHVRNNCHTDTYPFISTNKPVKHTVNNRKKGYFSIRDIFKQTRNYSTDCG